jgi:ATP-dependent RNA helicase DeaD
VAARGLDLPDLDLVIHADLPTNKATLLHRSGRTGRAGRKGVCLVLVPHSKRRRAETLLASANISALWEEPPSAAAIRAKDQARMFADPLLTEPPMDEDVALARGLLETYAPEVLGAALIRLYRARLPSPEELAPPPVVFERPAPVVRGPRPASGDGAKIWFRAPVGRKHNADPKWLIPLICRLGGVTKAEIGSIKIFDRETKFEISAGFAEAFDLAAKNAPASEMPFEPCTPPGFIPTAPRPVRPANPNAEQVRRRKNKAIKAIR